VLDALASGVPLIVTPIAYEQGAIAARVEASGAGLAVRPRQVPRSLGDACGRVLKEPRFRAAARRLGEESAAAGGVAAAAALVEAMAAGRSH
jgi:zeaxanthin glucosyltransferase